MEIEEKIKFVKTVERMKAILPVGIIPIFLCKFPSYNSNSGIYKIRSVLSTQLYDQDVLNKLEILVKFFEEKLD